MSTPHSITDILRRTTPVQAKIPQLKPQLPLPPPPPPPPPSLMQLMQGAQAWIPRAQQQQQQQQQNQMLQVSASGGPPQLPAGGGVGGSGFGAKSDLQTAPGMDLDEDIDEDVEAATSAMAMNSGVVGLRHRRTASSSDNDDDELSSRCSPEEAIPLGLEVPSAAKKARHSHDICS